MSKTPYYAKDGKVWKRAVHTAYDGGTTIEVGFPVCIPTKFCAGDAGVIAELMNRGAAATEERPMPRTREDAMTVMRKYAALDDIDSRLKEIATNGYIRIVFCRRHPSGLPQCRPRARAQIPLACSRPETATIRALGFDAHDLDVGKEPTQ